MAAPASWRHFEGFASSSMPIQRSLRISLMNSAETIYSVESNGLCRSSSVFIDVLPASLIEPLFDCLRYKRLDPVRNDGVAVVRYCTNGINDLKCRLANGLIERRYGMHHRP